MSNDIEQQSEDPAQAPDLSETVDAVEAGRPTRTERPVTEQSGGDRFWRGADGSGAGGADATALGEREIAESGDGRHGGTHPEGLDPTEPFRPAEAATAPPAD